MHNGGDKILNQLDDDIESSSEDEDQNGLALVKEESVDETKIE